MFLIILAADINESKWFELLSEGKVEEVMNSVNKEQDAMRLLRMQSQETSQHCLFYAVNLEDEKAGDSLLSFFLSKGATASHTDYLSQTALFYAAVKGHLSQLRALLAADSSPSHRDEYNQTPLFYAAREGHTDVIRALVKQGGDVNAADHQGHTALHYAARHGQIDAVKLLVDLGASVDNQGNYRQTPRKWAENAGFAAIAAYLGRLESSQRESRGGKSVKRVKATLMKVSPTGEATAMTPDELKAFEAAYPDIAKYWQSEEGMEELSAVDSDALLEATRPWEPKGKALVRKIWKIVGAEIFHEPVDPIKLNLPDYFDVVKAPMDLGTIKNKLFHNAYKDGETLMNDFTTMFANCKAYNEGDEEVLGMCAHVEDSFRTTAEALGLMKGRTTAEERKKETEEICRQYPGKVPVFVEKYKDSELPEIQKKKFLAPSDTTIGGFICGLRRKLNLQRSQAFFVFLEGRELLSGDSLMSEIYQRKKNEDGFLYLVYREQESVGEL